MQKDKKLKEKKKSPEKGEVSKKYPATGKLYFRIPLLLESPVIIGSGDSEYSDVDILREPVFPLSTRKPNSDSATESPGKNSSENEMENQFLIPATSIIGVFRAYLERGLGQFSKSQRADIYRSFIYLFGARDPQKVEHEGALPKPQSALQCEDILLIAEEDDVKIRDGVAIDPQKNTAIDKKKYAYEVLEYTRPFDLFLEITIRNGFDRAIFKRLLGTVFHGIKNGHIRLGAKTNKGFGRLAIEKDKIKMAELDFKKPGHVYQWLSNSPNYEMMSLESLGFLEFMRKEFNIEAWFRLKSSLLVKSYDVVPGGVDAVHISSRGKYILPGTSIMGAVQHRARKILNTLGLAEAELTATLRCLFGYEGEEGTGQGARKGRVRIEEAIVKNPFTEIQTRIKIDRFTGGTMAGALFEMMPLWQNGHDSALHISMNISNYRPWEAALFLFILKDLWTGDLAIGGEKNVGRGVLEGVEAKIEWDKQPPVALQTDKDGRIIYDDNFKKLEKLAEKIQEVKNNEKTK